MMTGKTSESIASNATGKSRAGTKRTASEDDRIQITPIITVHAGTAVIYEESRLGCDFSDFSYSS